MLLAGCASSSESVTFGEKLKSSDKSISIYYDKFTQSKTYESSKGHFSLSQEGGVASAANYLHVYPRIKVENGACSPLLELEYTGYKGGLLDCQANREYKKFIFLSGNNAIEIAPKISALIDSYPSGAYIRQVLKYNMQVSTSQWLLLEKYFNSVDKFECAAYSVDNEAVMFKSYNKYHSEMLSEIRMYTESENSNIEWNTTAGDADIKYKILDQPSQSTTQTSSTRKKFTSRKAYD